MYSYMRVCVCIYVLNNKMKTIHIHIYASNIKIRLISLNCDLCALFI